jgi:hypothetical protein
LECFATPIFFPDPGASWLAATLEVALVEHPSITSDPMCYHNTSAVPLTVWHIISEALPRGKYSLVIQRPFLFLCTKKLYSIFLNKIYYNYVYIWTPDSVDSAFVSSNNCG